MPDLVVGATVAGCRLEALAGQGGMGVVWRAVQVALNRPVAVKVIAPQYARDAAFRERFQRESQLAASIEHPNVIPVYEAGELDDLLYLIMRWVDGTALRELLTARGRLAPADATRLLLPVALALGAAHRRGLIHRDVKPANVLISGYASDDEHVYLTDFGIARRSGADMTMTRTGQLVGTIDYIAPERIEGARGDARSDIYAFGCMLYEALTGEVPYDRDTEVTKMYAHLNDPIPSARASVPAVPESLDRMIAKAMAKQPADRFGSAEELARALTTAGQEPPRTELREPLPAAGSEAATVVAPATVAVPDREPGAAAVATKAVAGDTTVQAADAPTRADDRSPTIARRGPRRTSSLVVPAIGVLVVIGVLVAVLSSGGGKKNPATGTVSQSAASGSRPASTGGLRVVHEVSLSGTPSAITTDPSTGQIWVAGTGYVFTEPAAHKTPFNGTPSAIAAGDGKVWISDPTAGLLRRFTATGGQLVPAGSRSSNASLLVVDPSDGSTYAADTSGRVGHIGSDMQFTQLGVVTPAPVSLAFGEGHWLWAVNGRSLIRMRAATPTATFGDGSDPVSVTLNRGVWAAHGDGHVTQFDPRGSRLRVNTTLAVSASAPLATVAAAESSADVWAASPQTKTVYRIDYATKRVSGTMTLPSAPIGLAVTPAGVWVITRDGRLVEIS